MKTSIFRHKIGVPVVVALLATCISSVPTGAYAANKLVVQDNSSTPVDKFVVSDTGFIGSGTNTPKAGLHIQGSDGPSTQFVNQFVGIPANPGTGGGGFIGYHNNPSATNNGLPVAGDRLGYFYFGTFDGSNALNSAGISARTDVNWTSTYTPSFFVFETTDGGPSARVERMRITASGNVGIGAKNPAQKLEIDGGLRLYPSTAKPTCDATIRGTIFFKTVALPGADTLEVCSRGADGSYIWRNIIGP